MTTEEKIKESLIEQLKAQNKYTDYCIDMVNTYMTHWRLKELLAKDIEEKGLRVNIQSGNGFITAKPNNSVADLQKTTSIMLSILDKMGLKEPVLASSADDYL